MNLRQKIKNKLLRKGYRMWYRLFQIRNPTTTQVFCSAFRWFRWQWVPTQQEHQKISKFQLRMKQIIKKMEQHLWFQLIQQWISRRIIFKTSFYHSERNQCSKRERQRGENQLIGVITQRFPQHGQEQSTQQFPKIPIRNVQKSYSKIFK